MPPSAVSATSPFRAVIMGSDLGVYSLARAFHEAYGTTSVVVAQRVSTVRDADQIVVLDAGRVVGLGSHEQLMADCPTYVEIVLSQMSMEEAA